MYKTTVKAASIVLLALLAAGAAAQTASTASRSQGRSTVAHADAAFLKQAAQNGHAEVQASKLAESKASSAKVKEFGKQMIADHTKAGHELTALAASKGVEVPDGPSTLQNAQLKLLGTTEGAKFDRQFANEFGVKAHEDTVKLFSKAANEAKDPDVKAWANQTLPTLKQHLTHAHDLKASVNKSNP